MKKLLVALTVLGFAFAAQAQKPAKTAKEAKITGEVVDITCFASHGAKGEKHAACASKCLQAGMPAGILAHRTLYVATMADHSSPSTKLAPWAGKMVTATGHKMTKNGTHVFEIDTVEPAAGAATKTEGNMKGHMGHMKDHMAPKTGGMAK